MSADYAGAQDAIKAKFAAEWLTDGQPRTLIANVNEPLPDLNDAEAGTKRPFVLVEIISLPTINYIGGKLDIYPGLLKLHIFVESGTGTDGALKHALAAGEIFRNKIFYDDVTPGCFIRTELPRVDDGTADSEDGSLFGTTATVAFEYWHHL
jgi:hypothetical protein